MRKNRYVAVLCLALLLVCAATPARAAVFFTDVRVRVSVGKQRSISFTPVGEFTLQEEPGLTVGNEELQVSIVGGRVSMRAGGKTVTAASLTLLSGNYGGRADYIRLKNSEYGTCTYLGNMTFDVYEGAVRAVNTLPVEQYLYGVVPHEMSNLFPVDALKAQAVCARGYAMAKCSRYAARAYDLLDTSQDQVYRGYASKNTRAIAAVDATSGQVLTCGGEIIEAYYSASNGGQTEKTGNVWENDLPYYTHADDPFDLLNASSLEEKSFIPEAYTGDTLRLMDPMVLLALERAANGAAEREVTLIATVDVTPKSPGYDQPSRSYTEADVTLMVGYEEGGQQKTGQLTVTLALEELKFGSFENTLGRIGASRTRLRMRGAERGVYRSGKEEYAGWYLTERRYGHGVGLSQRGAQERARAGQPYTDILSFYYTNTALVTVGTYGSAPGIGSEAYRVRDWGISGISPGTPADALLQRLSSEGKLSVVNMKGAETTGAVSTGFFVRVTYDDGKAFFDLPIVVFGDIDGDGGIAEGDVLALQSHLARETPLTGARLRAADVNHDGEADAFDLLLLIRSINGDAKLSQEGEAK
ncbi:MAG TPA: SpoIID/LytB domain-containing protein [Feifaniaceae bacterium]|nr:SpoIID/LytB domain-containing protein [Feifaniaceae bacterium]